MQWHLTTENITLSRMLMWNEKTSLTPKEKQLQTDGRWLVQEQTSARCYFGGYGRPRGTCFRLTHCFSKTTVGVAAHMVRCTNRQTIQCHDLLYFFGVFQSQIKNIWKPTVRSDGWLCSCECPLSSQQQFNELRRETKATGPTRRFRRVHGS